MPLGTRKLVFPQIGSADFSSVHHSPETNRAAGARDGRRPTAGPATRRCSLRSRWATDPKGCVKHSLYGDRGIFISVLFLRQRNFSKISPWRAGATPGGGPQRSLRSLAPPLAPTRFQLGINRARRARGPNASPSGGPQLCRLRVKDCDSSRASGQKSASAVPSPVGISSRFGSRQTSEIPSYAGGRRGRSALKPGRLHPTFFVRAPAKSIRFNYPLKRSISPSRRGARLSLRKLYLPRALAEIMFKSDSYPSTRARDFSKKNVLRSRARRSAYL